MDAPALGQSVECFGQRIAAVRQRDAVVYEVRLYRKGAWLVDGHPHGSFVDALDRCEYLASRELQMRPDARPAPVGGIAYGDVGEWRPDQRSTPAQRPVVHRSRNAASLAARVKKARAANKELRIYQSQEKR